MKYITLIFYFIAYFSIIGCNNESKNDKSLIEYSSSEMNISKIDKKKYRPFLFKEQIINNKKGQPIREIKFLNDSIKKMTDYYPELQQVRAIKYFKNDFQDGKTTIFFRGGKLKEVQYYANGKQVGIDTMFYENQKIHFLYTFKNDKKNGWMHRYSNTGDLEYSVNYKDDKPVEVIDKMIKK